ncbi:TNF receptor-associated factor 2 [Scleropages formosus]|uniref:TNF receptor-associated factor n=1 Tax=Scleropages formosus TaxID=113540 RepID=A0A8C9V1A8_SCLFO|nr:TNF receptor-associated factor 2-like [Scleropages formosus]XP_018600344.1 TNF receptor-associated factor 2-like [Scleropages formosus]XP_018600345.1 TNF receptor-associated factor 2-like [Scleropages formosus]XP_018600346.1 TNF receptor-associated factor 2-like [Scleropages formosus]XP_018600347.1 TNF receptor-associated factor 2-like [Scleropages formosus]XP_018600349.1 TNF receptor-associated factor 2-like [Scleropages formosus]XP_018600350.1 TNF receptor-associated factor 2-like [Scler
MARVSPAPDPDPAPVGMPQQILAVPMQSKYQCQQCHELLRRPVQALCGHRFCVRCLAQLTSSGPKPCEACRIEEIFEEPLSILNSSDAFPDNAARREIESLPANCPNEGCSWKGLVKEYEAQHEGKCMFDRVPCKACRLLILRSEQEKHSERECEERTLNCKYCKASFNFKDIKAHDEVCQKFPMQCKDCGKKKIPREKFPEHSKSCVKSKVACPFTAVGCRALVEHEKQAEHEQASAQEHLRLLLDCLCQLRRQGDGPGEWQEDSGPGLYCAPEERPTATAASAKLTATLEQKTTALENIVCVLNREVERSSLTLEAFARQHRLDQEKIENLTNKVRQLERSLTLRDMQLSETEQKLRELEYCTHDGVFVWKITEFSRRRQEALAGRAPAMFSPAFFSSKYGYKMCLRLYLNGDGTGRGTHLSLFFVVMKGRFDALLKWPFSQKVTLMLLDQNNREHIIDAFRPDITSSSFQRPVSEMNIASGCPLFCPLSKLAGKSSYLRDDTIFIKAIVDLSGL